MFSGPWRIFPASRPRLGRTILMLFVVQRAICARTRKQSVWVSRYAEPSEFFRTEEDCTLLSWLEVEAPDEGVLWTDMRSAASRVLVSGVFPSEMLHERLSFRFHVAGALRSVWQAEFRQLVRHLWIP